MERVKLSRKLGTGASAGPGPRRVPAITVRASDTARPMVLRAAALFDGVSSTLMAGPSVVVADGVIAAVHGPAGPFPAGARVVDLPGLTLLPGLVDAHLHLCFDASDDPVGHLAEAGDDLLRERMAEAARRALRAGVTTVRDLGDRGYLALDQRDSDPGGGVGPPPTIVGNPLQDLAAIRMLRAVYIGGRPVLPAPGSPASNGER